MKSQPTETFHRHIPYPPLTIPGHEDFAIRSAVTKASDNLVICEREDSKMVSSLRGLKVCFIQFKYQFGTNRLVSTKVG